MPSSNSSTSMQPGTRRLALTAGEPAGIGPDLCIALCQEPPADVELVIIADPALLESRAKSLGLPLELIPYDSRAPRRATAPGTLGIKAVTLAANCTAGTLDPRNAPYVLETLRVATDATLAGEFDALVTGPVHKGVINDAGVAFSGHTEFFAERSGCDLTVMMLATEGLRVALATTHLPLAAVPAAITRESLTRIIQILDADLRAKFGIAKPRIVVCGLNPHAGEGGHLGREEIEVIEPVLEALRDAGIDLVGPLPADTLFTPRHLDDADAVLSMFHDQGLPVLKFKGFGAAVNITLGLPFIRTSVDHGTALDLAGTGKASAGSLAYAIATARTMAAHCSPLDIDSRKEPDE